MRMPLEVIPATIEQKPVLARLLELYIYDGTAYSGHDVDAEGRFGYRYLDHYWEEIHRFPYLFRVGGKWAGFGLVNAYTVLPTNPDGWSLAEFFVMRKYRRAGIGRMAFHQLLARHPGRWEIRVEQMNVVGLAFWPVVIDELTSGAYECLTLTPTAWDGPIYSFDFPSPQATQT